MSNLVKRTAQKTRKTETIVVSDLHIDTWEESSLYGKSKTEHFLDFLDEIQPIARRFVINGDLLDALPRSHNIFPQFLQVLTRLYELSEDTEIYYFIGNHDIGLGGLKVQGIHNVNVIYPTGRELFIDFGEGEQKKWVYFEHGHSYDLVLALYAFTTAVQMLPQRDLLELPRKLLSKAQEGLRGMTARGLREARNSLFTNAYKMVRRAGQRRDAQSLARMTRSGISLAVDLPRRLGPGVRSALESFVDDFYGPAVFSKAAQELFRRFCEMEPERNISAIVFGHTHQPWAKAIEYKGRRALYLNSGDWDERLGQIGGEKHHASYIRFDSAGNGVMDSRGYLVRDYLVEKYGAAG